VVNNELTMRSAGSQGETNAGGICGAGPGEYWVGNHIHDTAGTSQNQTHGIYVNTGPGTYEIAYNWIEDVGNGTGIQLDGPTGSATPVATGAHIHHNVVHDTLKYGIEIGNFGNGTGSIPDIAVWNNLVYNTQGPGLIFNAITGAAPLRGAFVYSNTFYDVCTQCAGFYGAIDNDNGSVLTSSSASFVNNIVVPSAGQKYVSDLSGATGIASIGASNNLFFGGMEPTIGTSAVTTDPGFGGTPPPTQASSGSYVGLLVPGAGSPVMGTGSSSVATGNGIAAMPYFPAFGGVTDDFVFAPRPAGAAFSIGCYQ
jgi:hypothetical protein